MRIAIVAGEASGDILGAGLIRALKVRWPDAEFIGMAGPLMQSEGCQSLFDIEHLSVMGLVEVLDSLPQLFELRRQLVGAFTSWNADIFIGIDAPDFNLRLAAQVKAAGIPTVHYVSPSVWAWRQGRIHGIKRVVDLMLTLLPFEAEFYTRWQVPVAFVGHPLADEIPLGLQKAPAREALGLGGSNGLIYALLPGSRRSEVGRLGLPFLQAASLILREQPDAVFIVPAANHLRVQQIAGQLSMYPELAESGAVRVILERSRLAMQAADGVLLASGTASLEAMLVGRPMVVAYKLAPLTYHIMKLLMKSPFVSLPNLLAGSALVPELIQHAATPHAMATALMTESRPERASVLASRFTELHEQIRRNASDRAAAAIAEHFHHLGL